MGPAILSGVRLLLGLLLVASLCAVQPGIRAGAQATSEPAAVRVERDVAYGEANGEPLLLNVFRPADRDTPRPAVLLIFGGGWMMGGRTEMDATAQLLAQAGYVAFSIDHRLADGTPEHGWPGQLDDAQRAVRWMRAHAAEYGVDPDRLCSLGWSSGAHLASMLGVRETRDNADPELAAYSSRVQCVVSLSGDMDLSVPQPSAMSEYLVANLLGGVPADQPEAARDASPISWVDEEAAAFLIVHGGEDDASLVEPSRRMATALFEARVETVYAVIPTAAHDGTNSWSLTGPLILGFLESQVHPAS